MPVSKSYCTCSKDYICRELVTAPLTFQNDKPWVHHLCNLPFRAVWESYIRRCQSCLREKSLPWETLCQSCFKDEFENGALSEPLWHGWKAAALTMHRAIRLGGPLILSEMEGICDLTQHEDRETDFTFGNIN